MSELRRTQGTNRKKPLLTPSETGQAGKPWETPRPSDAITSPSKCWIFSSESKGEAHIVPVKADEVN